MAQAKQREAKPSTQSFTWYPGAGLALAGADCVVLWHASATRLGQGPVRVEESFGAKLSELHGAWHRITSESY